jgi:hypothetical protein
MRCGVDDSMMHACFDAKLLHISCKNCCIFYAKTLAYLCSNFGLCGLLFAGQTCAARNRAHSFDPARFQPANSLYGPA